MHIVEKFVSGKKNDPNLCEDAIIVSDHFIAVIDGATDKTGKQYNGVTGGKFATQTIANKIEKISPKICAFEAFELLTNAFTQSISRDALGCGNGPSASVTIYSRSRREIWQVGDVSYTPVGVSLRAPTSFPIDEIASRVRSFYTKKYLADNVSAEVLRITDPGRAKILPLLREQWRFSNTIGRWGFGTVNGNSIPSQLISVNAIESDVKEMIIYTDGFPLPCRTLETAEQNLQHLLVEDPLCISALRSTKSWNPLHCSYDDRAYVRFQL